MTLLTILIMHLTIFLEDKLISCLMYNNILIHSHQYMQTSDLLKTIFHRHNYYKYYLVVHR